MTTDHPDRLDDRMTDTDRDTAATLTKAVTLDEPDLPDPKSLLATYMLLDGYDGNQVAAYFAAQPPQDDQARIDAAHIEHQRAWSTETFGPREQRGPLGPLAHLRKEVEEVADNPYDLEEWVDCIILALDGAWRASHEPQVIIDAVKAKQAKNEARTWPDWRTVPANQAIEHVRVQPPQDDREAQLREAFTELARVGEADGRGQMPHLAARIREVLASVPLATDTPGDDPQPDEREALAEARERWLWHDGDDDRRAGWGGHMSQMLARLPDDQETRDMQASIEWMLAKLAAGFSRRDPDAGLRERVEQAVDDVLGRTGDERLRQAMAHVRAALAEPTPGTES